MATLYRGTVLAANGKPISGVKTIITAPIRRGGINEIKSYSTTTSSDGNWVIQIFDSITNPKEVTLVFSKSNFTLNTIKNPQSDGTYNPPILGVDPNGGGRVRLRSGFDSGKYLVSSLNLEDTAILYIELSNASKFIELYPNNYEIVIKASESKLTNRDNEEFLEDGTPNPNFDQILPQKSLSTKRANNLIKFIKSTLSDFSLNIPDSKFKQNIIVGEDELSQEDRDILNTFDRNTPEYKNVLRKFKPNQYVEISLSFISPPCANVKVESQNQLSANLLEKSLIKPPSSKTIYLDTYEIPDRLGLNGKYKDYFTQSIPYGSLITTQFLIYLNIFQTPGLNSIEPLTKFPLNQNQLKQSLLEDIKIGLNPGESYPQYVNTIAQQLQNFLLDIIGRNANANNFTPSGLIDAVLGITGAFGYEVKRETTTFDLSNIDNNSSFIINSLPGGYKIPSVWQYRICAQ